MPGQPSIKMQSVRAVKQCVRLGPGPGLRRPSSRQGKRCQHSDPAQPQGPCLHTGMSEGCGHTAQMERVQAVPWEAQRHPFPRPAYLGS